MSTRIHNAPGNIRGGAQLAGVLAEMGLLGLGDRSRGTVVTDHRSSWVRRYECNVNAFFVKTYDYPSAWDRWRGVLRNTGPWTASRAVREYTALMWMVAHELPCPAPIGVVETRHLGFLRRTILITAAFPGESVETLLPSLSATDRTALGLAIGALVGTLHRLGFRDRNLDTRNLLAHRTDPTDRSDAGWCVAKIDSPRFRLRQAGSVDDALTRADWRRLLPQLVPHGLAEAAREGARLHSVVQPASPDPA